MRTLALTVRQAWPPVSGAKLRDFYLAKALGQAGELTYAFFTEPDGPSAGPEQLPFCHKLISIPRPRMFQAELLKGLGGDPIHVRNFTSPQMLAAVRQELQQQSFDLIYFDTVHLAGLERQLLPEFGAATVIYNWHNIESELLWRYSRGDHSWPRRMYARRTARLLERVEQEILERADGHIVCSQREAATLQKRAPKARIAVVENGVDTAAYALERSVNPTRLVFVGSMDYHANVDGALWFTRELWPRIRSRFPEWTLTLVGSNPAPEVDALGALEGVEVTGTVPDVKPYYQQAVAALVPLRVGGGTRLKILEAMAAGIPVVSTPLGAEGLDVKPGQHILFAEALEQWIDAFDVIQNGGTADLVAEASQLVHSHYDWNVVGAGFLKIAKQWLESPQ